MPKWRQHSGPRYPHAGQFQPCSSSNTGNNQPQQHFSTGLLEAFQVVQVFRACCTRTCGGASSTVRLANSFAFNWCILTALRNTKPVVQVLCACCTCTGGGASSTVRLPNSFASNCCISTAPPDTKPKVANSGGCQLICEFS